MQHSQKYQLGRWVVCPRTNSFVNADEQKPIDNKSMQVLLFLIQHAGKNVSKEQIIEHVWKESVVNEEILSVAISKIRKALGDNARQPTFIKTIPNLGYCLISNVKQIDESEPTRENSLSASERQNKYGKHYLIASILLLIAIILVFSFSRNSQQPEKPISISSIAVLPFEDLTKGQDNKYFTEGLSDAIINQLSQANELKVISRYSSFNFRASREPVAIGDALKVEAVLDGSVQRLSEQIRINVQIISTFDGRLLWAKSFDSHSKNIFNLQDKISQALRLAIQPNSEPNLVSTKKIDSQAYEWFLMAQYHWRQREPNSLLKAETYFRHSLELEPNYADAHVGLAITYAHFHFYGNWTEKQSVDKALPHIEQALRIEPDSPTALTAKGMLLRLQASFAEAPQPIWAEAERLFIRSLELEDSATTHHWYSSLLLKMGKSNLVKKHMERAIALNPLSASLKRIYSEYLAINGKVDTAQSLYQRALILDPDRASNAIESTQIYRNTPSLINAVMEWHINNSEFLDYCSSEEYCEQVVFSYLSIGQDKEANKILARMASKHEHFKNSLKLIDYGLTGNDKSAVTLLEQLSVNHPNNYKYKFSLAQARYRAGLYQQAKTQMLKLYPAWNNKLPNEVTADNYLAQTLFGAILLKLNEQEDANSVFNNIAQFLKLGLVQDKAQAELVLAQVNAQLAQADKALEHLRKALNHGWLETFDRDWWTLNDNHLLEPLENNNEFKMLVQEHQRKVKRLAEQVSSRLVGL